ncbi:unnamed protein product [Rotaria socialis]
MWSSTFYFFLSLSIFVDKVQPEVPQLFDYLNGFYLDCYECHSNRPGCGEKLDWILMRWKRCVAPGGSKCVKIIEHSPDGEINYVRGCINQIEAVRPEMPTVRENGCWAASDKYIGLAYRPCERYSLNVALIVYRDHPPQEHTFAIQLNDFTGGDETAKTNVTSSVPRSGNPSGHDLIECAALLAERSITLYKVGCEPAVKPYRNIFMPLAFKTGGQYIPLNNAGNLSSR